jgi:hypothetical protein
MATNKTGPTGADVDSFLAAVPDDRRRADARRVCDLMHRLSGEQPVMWGPSMIGFGFRHYRYASGHEGDTFVVGFSPRKAALVIYGVYSEYDDSASVLASLGAVTAGKGCVYVKRLDAVDLGVLEGLIARAVASG